MSESVEEKTLTEAPTVSATFAPAPSESLTQGESPGSSVSKGLAIYPNRKKVKTRAAKYRVHQHELNQLAEGKRWLKERAVQAENNRAKELTILERLMNQMNLQNEREMRLREAEAELIEEFMRTILTKKAMSCAHESWNTLTHQLQCEVAQKDELLSGLQKERQKLHEAHGDCAVALSAVSQDRDRLDDLLKRQSEINTELTVNSKELEQKITTLGTQLSETLEGANETQKMQDEFRTQLTGKKTTIANLKKRLAEQKERANTLAQQNHELKDELAREKESGAVKEAKEAYMSELRRQMEQRISKSKVEHGKSIKIFFPLSTSNAQLISSTKFFDFHPRFFQHLLGQDIGIAVFIDDPLNACIDDHL